jgi:hypothetical protein
MASLTILDTLNMASSWPTDYALFESAKAKAPEYAKQLDYLMEDTEQVMREKDLLDHRVGQVLDLEVMIAHDWPTHIGLFRMAIDKLNAHQDYEISEELDDRWDLVNEKMTVKKNLDDTIVQILNGTYIGDSEKASGTWDSTTPLLAGHSTPPASPPFMEPPPIERLPRVVSVALEDSGAFEHDYGNHGFFTESDVEDMRQQREEQQEANEEEHEQKQEAKEVESQGGAQMSEHNENETHYSILLSNRLSFSPLTLSAPQQRVMSYIDKVDAWARDVERLIAESKAIREAPLASFADLAGYEDDDSIPEVDIEAL